MDQLMIEEHDHKTNYSLLTNCSLCAFLLFISTINQKLTQKQQQRTLQNAFFNLI